MLRLAGSIADGVLLNYLPASLVPWCVERVREGGDADVYAYVHCGVTDRDRYADLARKDLLNYAVVDAYANQFARGGLRRRRRRRSARSGRRASATPRSPRSATRGSTTSRSWATPRTCGPRSRPTTQAGAKPIVFALPWGEDRRATVGATLQALA